MPKNLKRKDKILVSGSLGIDSIFGLGGTINSAIHFSGKKLGKQNMMFFGKDKKECFGGTAGNIAYGLGLMKERPIVVSAAGKDFGPFKDHLKRFADLRVVEDKDNYTAVCYMMTDDIGEQIGIFQPNAYGIHSEKLSLKKQLTNKDWKDIGIAIFSPGAATNMVSQMKEFRKAGRPEAMVIFDPGQIMLISFTWKLLEEAFRLSDMCIVNDFEFKMLRERFGFSVQDIFKLGVTFVIETQGAKGSTLYEPDKTTHVAAVRAKKVVDPTGAGDAFRAGLISGLNSGMSMVKSMARGAKLGALSIEHQGGQTYSM